MKETKVRYGLVITAVIVGLVGAVGVSGALTTSVGQGDTYGQEISFVAFCAEDDVDEGDVSLTPMESNEGELVAVDYSVTGTLDTVTYKAGQTTREFTSPSNPGTVTSGDGDPSSISGPNPCPAGQDGVKFEEYNAATDSFDGVEETED